MCHYVLVSIAVSAFVESSFLYVAALPILLEVVCPELSAVDQDARSYLPKLKANHEEAKYSQ